MFSFRFKEGLSYLQLTNNEALTLMFQYNDTKLTAEAIDSLFVNIQRSEKDSNKEIKENETLAYWRDFLQEVEGKYSAHSLYYNFQNNLFEK